MEPARKHDPNIEPDIRPRFGVIDGGGESSPERANLETAQDLDSRENDTPRRFGVIDGGGESTPERASLEAVNNAEKDGFWTGNSEDSGQDKRSLRQRVTALVTGKKAATGGLIGILFATVTGISFFSAPSMLLVQVKEVFTNYGASSSRAANSQFEENLYYRLAGGTAEACAKPGAISTIRCKRGTMSEKTHKKLLDSGFDVKSQKVNGRYVITSVAKDGITIDGKSSRTKIKNAMKHPDFGSSMRRSSNWSTDVFNGGRFSSIVLKKLGLSKSKVELSGSNDEERKESANKITGAADEDTDDKRKAKFEGAHKSKIEGVGKIAKGPGASVGVFCSGYNMSRATITAMKLYNAARYASLAILFFKAADQIKANGQVDPQTVALLGGVLTSYATTGPTKGLTATDSQGYKVAAYGGEGDLKSFSSRFLLGGNEKLIDLDTTINSIQEKTPGGKGTLKTTCKAATDELASAGIAIGLCGGAAAAGGGGGFIAGTIVPVIGNAIGGVGGAVTGAAVCAAVSFGAGFVAGAVIGKIFNYILSKVIESLTESSIDVNKIKGVEAGDAIAAGAGVIMENTNISRGLQPGTKESVTAFQNSTADDKVSSDAIARYEAKDDPFDIYNEYSFLGSFIRKSGIIEFNSGSTIGNISNLFNIALSPLSFSTNASALGTAVNITKKDLSNCPDKSLRDIGVDCDVVGGTQYSMATNISEESNLNFMIGTHVDESGNPTSDDYTNWVKYCTDQREDPIGSTSVGIEDEDAWKIGEACVANSNEEIDQTTRDQFSTYYYRNAAVEDEDYVSPAATTAGGAANFTVSSYNMCHEVNHDSGPSMCPVISTKQGKIVQTIKGNSNLGNPAFDIIGVQELSQPTQKAVIDGTGYGTFPLVKDLPSSNGRAIFWNPSKFTQGAESGWLKGVHGNGGNHGANSPNDQFPWVQLMSGSGQSVYVLSMHNPLDNFADPRGSEGGTSNRSENAAKIREWAESKTANGSLVIVTGDFNQRGKLDGDYPTAHCVFSEGGFMLHAMDMAKNNQGCDSNVPIDQIYASTNISGLKASGWSRVTNMSEKTGTDHSPAWVTYDIPGEDDGSIAESATFGNVAFPLKGSKSVVSNPDIFKNGTTNTAGHPYTSYDILAATGTEVVAFADGTVSYESTDKCPGKFLTIWNESAKIGVSYMHLSDHISLGTKVKAGDHVGTVGSAAQGCGTPHLHIDASTDKIRQPCSREACSAAVKSTFRNIGKELFTTYQGLPN